MSNQPKPILCDTDSEFPNHTENLAKEIFQQHEVPIPNLSVAAPTSEEHENQTRRPNTPNFDLGENARAPRSHVQVETVSNIIARLAKQNDEENESAPKEDIDESTNYVTIAKLEKIVGDTRVDFMKIIDLNKAMNENIKVLEKQIKSLQENMNSLIQDNIALTERLDNHKDDMRSRYQSLSQNIGSKLEDMTERVTRVEVAKGIELTNNVIDSRLARNTRVMKRCRKCADVTAPLKNSKSKSKSGTNESAISDANDEELDVKPNVILDSQMKARTANVRVVPKKSLKTKDFVNGFVPEEDPNNVDPRISRQALRKANFESSSKKIKNTRNYRLQRFGLHDMYAGDFPSKARQ